MPAAGGSAPACWIGSTSLLVDLGSLLANCRGGSTVALVGRQEFDSAVAVPIVVPVHKRSHPLAGWPQELPPEAPTDPYVTLSRHTAPVIPTLLPQVMPMAPLVDGSALFSEPLAFLPANWLMLWLSLDNAAPLLQSHYSSFITTTGCSAPAMGIGIRPRGCGHLWLSLLLRRSLTARTPHVRFPRSVSRPA